MIVSFLDTKKPTKKTNYLIVVIWAMYSSGLEGRESSLCVSRKFRALVCSFSISMVKLEGNQPHCKSLSLSPSYQPDMEGKKFIYVLVCIWVFTNIAWDSNCHYSLPPSLPPSLKAKA